MRQRLLQATSNIGQSIVAVIIGMLLTIGILLFISDDPSHPDLLQRQETMLDNQRVMLCLMLYPDGQRTPEVLASCQTPVAP